MKLLYFHTSRQSKGNIKGFVKSFVKYYENIDFSREIYFNVFKKKKDDEFGSSELIIAYAGVDGEEDQLVERFIKRRKWLA